MAIRRVPLVAVLRRSVCAMRVLGDQEEAHVVPRRFVLCLPQHKEHRVVQRAVIPLKVEPLGVLCGVVLAYLVTSMVSAACLAVPALETAERVPWMQTVAEDSTVQPVHADLSPRAVFHPAALKAAASVQDQVLRLQLLHQEALLLLRAAALHPFVTLQRHIPIAQVAPVAPYTL